ncbi:MAG: FtsX-like permease family protein, partial [Candidatus Neomarinimicrobiota bacterium]
KLELDQHSSILEVANSTAIPGQPTTMNTVLGMNPPDGGDQIMQLMNGYVVDFNFQQTFELEMVEGRWFDSQFSTDSGAAVINQAAAEAYGLDEYVGQELIAFFGPDGTTRIPIIGIVKDFHYESLHSEIKPMFMASFGGLFFGGGGGPVSGKFTALRIAPDPDPQLMSYIETTWMNSALDQAFEYVWFDDMFNALYAEEARTSTIATMFAVLAIFVASLGLLGLASFTAEQRTKEVGIRKVLGATVAGIFGLLSSDILKLVAASAIISLPISYYVMNNWLENFAYRISYSLLTFAVASLLAIVIAILTVSWQAFKAATSNPVTALRYE